VTAERLRVLLADDNSPFRGGVRALLEVEEDLEVVGEAGDARETVALALAIHADIVLMDLGMPHGGGIEATRQLASFAPHVHVLVVTMFEDDLSVYSALEAGARGYVLKGARRAELLRAVRGVGAGGVSVGPAVAGRVLRRFTGGGPGDAVVFASLTARERQVLVLLAAHLTNSEIAARLQLSEKTVRNHVSNLFTKLGVSTRAEAVTTAREAGLGPPVNAGHLSQATRDGCPRRGNDSCVR
jgi:DNA-binding NarL/FixJ family response regulator